MVSWQSKEKASKPNAIQDAALMAVVSERLVDEVFYEYAKGNNPAKLTKKNEKKQTFFIAKKLADAALGRVEKEIKKE